MIKKTRVVILFPIDRIGYGYVHQNISRWSENLIGFSKSMSMGLLKSILKTRRRIHFSV